MGVSAVAQAAVRKRTTMDKRMEGSSDLVGMVRSRGRRRGRFASGREESASVLARLRQARFQRGARHQVGELALALRYAHGAARVAQAFAAFERERSRTRRPRDRLPQRFDTALRLRRETALGVGQAGRDRAARTEAGLGDRLFAIFSQAFVATRSGRARSQACVSGTLAVVARVARRRFRLVDTAGTADRRLERAGEPGRLGLNEQQREGKEHAPILPERGRLSSFLLDRDLFVLQVEYDLSPLFQVAEEDPLRERLLEDALDQPRHRPRSELRRKAFFRQPLACIGPQLELDVLLFQLRTELVDLF